MTFRFSRMSRAVAATLAGATLIVSTAMAGEGGFEYFERIATFPVYQNTDIGLETVAEIVAASADGHTLIYTDSETAHVGFVDIANPADPQPAGVVALGGEPTSVAVGNGKALVAVDTSPDLVNPSGRLLVIDIEGKDIVATFELGGQPDSVAVSRNGRFAAIVVENERDEDLNDGALPQLPAGFLTILDMKGPVDSWRLRTVDLTGVADLFPEDPEPEYVDINALNVAVVTLQENNHIVLVHLPSGTILNDFAAGAVDLDNIDINENDLIELKDALAAVPREPDGVSWITPFQFVTADEGDLNGGSRGFTLYDINGGVRFSAGNELERLVTRIGHYPENRSENKGNEPENIEFGRYGEDRLLFVGSERSSVVAVYEVGPPGMNPEFRQVLPTGVGPEGLLAIPARDLFVAASESDDRGDKFRSVLTIYQRTGESTYPTVHSADREDGTPIPWGALSALAVFPEDNDIVYSVYDSFYDKSRIFVIDVDVEPALITGEIILKDSLGVLATVAPDRVNDDASVNLDLEGLAARPDGGFWVVSEGAGSVDDESRPVETPNLALRVDPDGVIEKVVTLPETTNVRQRRFGFEGVASVGSGDDEVLYVAFQREWVDDPDNRVRIGRYDGEWRFFHYPIESPVSPNGGWVGLSEITALSDDRFAVIERDNQGGDDAAIKRIYTFTVAGLTPVADAPAGETAAFPVVEKTLVRDLIDDLRAPRGAVLEKIEGLAALKNGVALIVNDNDGVDDSNGETQLLKLDDVFDDE